MNRRVLPWADWVAVASSASASDGQLLFRFARLGEQQAFTQLVKRHGPLVWGVCWRLLRSHHDAEDAFQATFLILAKKAAGLHQPDALVNWLYGVACRTSLQLRSRRKTTLPLDVADEPAQPSVDQAAWRECSQVIDQAIMQLPGKLRVVFLLSQCDGLTTLAVARRLNIPEGTVVSRLHRARQQLQKALTRQGVASAAGAVAAGWCLALPESLVATTLHTILAAAPSLVVASLAYGVITTMFWMKLSTAVVMVVSLGLVGTGTAALLAQGKGYGGKGDAVSPIAQPPAIVDEKDNRIRELTRHAEEVEQQLRVERKQIVEIRDQLEKATKQSLVEQQQLQAVKQQLEALNQFIRNEVIGKAEPSAKLTVTRTAEEQAREDEVKRLRDYKIREEKQRNEEEKFSKAREQIEHRLADLYAQLGSLAQQKQSVAVYQKDYDRHAVLLANYEKQLSDVKSRVLDSETPITKNLIKLREQELMELDKLQGVINKRQAHPSQVTRIQAQISLHEKLLLEIEEKLLRKMFRLDD